MLTEVSSLWVGEEIDSYLAGQLRKGQKLLPKDQYPHHLKPHHTWHASLNHARNLTGDGYERYGIIGFNRVQSRVHLPANFARGEKARVPAEVVKKERKSAKKKRITYLGDIHSHPKLPNHEPLPPRLSAADFHYLLVGHERFIVECVVEGTGNVVVFKTAEALAFQKKVSEISPDEFERYWYESVGYKYLGNASQFGAYRIQTTPASSAAEKDPLVVNRMIAEHYGLVVYTGAVDQDMSRL